MFGNINKNVEIKEEDRYFHNVLMEKIIINPKDPLHPIVRKYVKVFRAIDYKKYFQCSQEDQIGFLKAMNYQTAELVHDPTIDDFVRPAIEKSFEQKFVELKKTNLTRQMQTKLRKSIKPIVK
jgi:hypothetical protein